MVNRKQEFAHLVTNLNFIPKDIVKGEIENVKQSPYRQHFHIESPFGMLGDPNGFSYFNGEYHLFHQWFPMKYSKNPNYFQQGWFHWISPNLVDWKPIGEAMGNDTIYDKYGVYSGSALPLQDKLFIMYNGNNWTDTETDHWKRLPSQLGAVMDQNNEIKKLKKPLIKGPINGYTGHFRDPKVFRKDNTYYAIIGAQKDNLSGTVLVYRSEDLLNWKKLGEINTSFIKKGYMWECPDYFESDDKGVLLFCPQGLESEENRFLNAFQACCAVGNPINFNDLKFESTDFNEIDLGFNFYAPQTMIAPDGRRILSAWSSIMNSNSPTIQYHYDGCEIFPRELTVHGNKLCQKPINEIKELYDEKYSKNLDIAGLTQIDAGTENCRDFQVTVNCKDSQQFILDLFADQKDQHYLRLIFNRMKSRFILDRSKAGISFEDEFGNERSCNLDLNRKVKIRIIQDISSVEIFLDNGEKVFTARIFVNSSNNRIYANSLGGNSTIKYTIYHLRKMK
ncbi:sucrose-6-phosphate hydrolase [Lactobacillus sp. HT06-2]|uniref:sucrose-6-phosphate hydrolase n=1 Tax=Lactobacillus sp. HT06-2 TaxID=2080222 RepID=UPI000CD94CC1|nr:sucrose-6-phosphate hydrolase [Lactobacillus sp. HT06-2]